MKYASDHILTWCYLIKKRGKKRKKLNVFLVIKYSMMICINLILFVIRFGMQDSSSFQKLRTQLFGKDSFPLEDLRDGTKR